MPMKINYSSLFIAFLILTHVTFSQTINCQSHKMSGVATTPIYYSPENLRSDTINSLKYTINLDITDFLNQKIKGKPFA